MASTTFTTWATALLKLIGAPATPENLRYLSAWQRAEGGHAAYNPFNTTEPYAGSSNYNTVGVKNYASYADGLRATYQTLINGHYGTILQVLRQGTASATAFADAVGTSPWGSSGSLIAKILKTAYTPGTLNSGGTGTTPGTAPTNTTATGVLPAPVINFPAPPSIPQRATGVHSTDALGSDALPTDKLASDTSDSVEPTTMDLLWHNHLGGQTDQGGPTATGFGTPDPSTADVLWQNHLASQGA